MVVLQALGVGLFLYIICSLSQAVKYYVKCSIFVLGAMFSASVLPIHSLLIYPIRDPRIGLIPALGTRSVMWLMGLTYEVRGEQHIDQEKGGVITINHQSGIDLAVIARIWPLIGRGTTVVKKLVLYVFPFGPGAWLWGTLYIDRRNHKDTMVKLDKECDAIKQRSNKIVIFPEGTRSQEDELLPFKKGPFHIAIQSQKSTGPLLWNDPSINYMHCTYPPAINSSQHIITAFRGRSQRFKMYASMANKTYYRWMYHKAKNTPASSQADINSLKPPVTFPDVYVFSTISQGTVSVFNPPTASYKLLCIPTNWSFSNSKCLVKNASYGSAPSGFGTADPVVSTIIWADRTAFAEWHCFEGERQVFNVISLRRYLTKRQIDSIV